MKRLDTTCGFFVNYDHVCWIVPFPGYYKVRIHDQSGNQVCSFLWKLNHFTKTATIELMRGKYDREVRQAIAEFSGANGAKAVSYKRLRCKSGRFDNKGLSR